MRRTAVFFLATFQSGGTEWFALRLARELKRHDVAPVFLVANPQGPLRDLIQGEFESAGLTATAYTFFETLRVLPSVVRFLIQKRPEVFIGGLTILNIVAALAIRIARTPTRLIVIEHMRLDEAAFSLPKKIKRFFKLLFVGLSYRLADEIVAVSQSAKDDLVRVARLRASRVRVVSNPVIPRDIDELSAQPPPHAWLREEPGRPRQTPVIVAIGRLLPNKDFSTLLRAFAKVLKRKPARLLVFGDGEDRPRLETLRDELGLSSHTEFPGSIDNVFSALKAADLFVLSSRSEAFGNVIVEALSCGTQVVSTDSGGPAEILEKGRWGTLVPPGNPALMAEAILAALDATPDRTALMAKGRHYGVEAAARAYLDMMEPKGTAT